MPGNVLDQPIDILGHDWITDFLGKHCLLPGSLDLSFAPLDVISLASKWFPAAAIPDVFDRRFQRRSFVSARDGLTAIGPIDLVSKSRQSAAT